MTLTQVLKSKTMLFSVALAALSVFQGYIGKIVLDPVEQMYIGMIVSGAIAGLRILTTTPIEEK